jgi:hypothetical protein
MRRRQWTAEEDRAVMTMKPREVAKKYRRGLPAVYQRKYNLKHPCVKPSAEAHWTPEMVTVLKREYPISTNTEELKRFFQNLTVGQITSKVRHLKLKRRYLGFGAIQERAHLDLADQIRIRAKDKGITFTKLDRMLHTKGYFRKRACTRRVNLRAVARAVAFFGGRVAIDWADR